MFMFFDFVLCLCIEFIFNVNCVVLFMKGQLLMLQCGFLVKVVGVLQDLGVEFVYVNVLVDQEICEGIKVYGDWLIILQLYIDGELVGGSDIVLQMVVSGELSSVLGLVVLDCILLSIIVILVVVEMFKGVLVDVLGVVLQLFIDVGFQLNFQFVLYDEGVIVVEFNGLCVQFDLVSVCCVNGIIIDWVDDIRGKGLVIDNLNVFKLVQEISVCDVDDLVCVGNIILVDVCLVDECEIVVVGVLFKIFDGNGCVVLEVLLKDIVLVFMCYYGGCSVQVVEQFCVLGFIKVFNVIGGINVWLEDVDNGVLKY